jgi:hypothetical protein
MPYAAISPMTPSQPGGETPLDLTPANYQSWLVGPRFGKRRRACRLSSSNWAVAVLVLVAWPVYTHLTCTILESARERKARAATRGAVD